MKLTWRALETSLLSIMLLVSAHSIYYIPPVDAEASVSPSKDWGVFFNTTGPIKVNITTPGVAVRLEVPQEFIGEKGENDTSFIKSDISNDYYYYKLIRPESRFPHEPNAPYTIEVWHPPIFLMPGCVMTWINFTPPRYILLEGLKAPSIAGLYNISVYIAPRMRGDGSPDYPPEPSKVVRIPVSMREDPRPIEGKIVDKINRIPIRTKGVVFAYRGSTVVAKAYVDPATGNFTLTGLYEGDYDLVASAGYFPVTGYAYAPTNLTSITGEKVHVRRGLNKIGVEFPLHRGCRIVGSIEYLNEQGVPVSPSDTPYIKAVKYNALNYTVEVSEDSDGARIVASQTYASKMTWTVENFTLIVRNGTKYVGDSALGTEYSGFGPGRYRVRAWVYGFTQIEEVYVTIGEGEYGTKATAHIRLMYGGVVSGTIRFVNGVSGKLETPREAEVSALGTSSGTKFGGNILIELYDADEKERGILRGVTVINGTYSNGTTIYADESTIRFWILGFSELYNHTYTGVWGERDYGLEGGKYYIKVWVRGYIQRKTEDFYLPSMGNYTITVWMERGGALDVTVHSYTSKVGTRVIQAPTPWRFLDLCPPPYLRVYLYRGSNEIGYAERMLKLGEAGVTETAVRLNFTGHNYPLQKIVFSYTVEGKHYIPYLEDTLAIDEGNYIVKAFTYGYVQTVEVNVYIPKSQTVSVAFPLIIGCGIYGSVPLMGDGLFTSLTENVTIRVKAILEGSLKGVDVVDAKEGDSSFSFHVYGFYGRGHFYYVDPEEPGVGRLRKDYGLDTGNYSVYIPEFGYDRHFMQEVEVYADLPWLMMERGVYFSVQLMRKIHGVIRDYDHQTLLSWIRVSSMGRESYSMDGYFAIHLPKDTIFEVTFEAWCYQKRTEQLSPGFYPEIKIKSI